MSRKKKGTGKQRRPVGIVHGIVIPLSTLCFIPRHERTPDRIADAAWLERRRREKEQQRRRDWMNSYARFN